VVQRGLGELADAKAESAERKLPYLVQSAKLDFDSPRIVNFCGKISVRNEKIGFLLTLLQDYGILVRTNRSYGNVGSSWSLGEAVSHLVNDSILLRD
jgi:hypothetical protein